MFLYLKKISYNTHRSFFVSFSITRPFYFCSFIWNNNPPLVYSCHHGTVRALIVTRAPTQISACLTAAVWCVPYKIQWSTTYIQHGGVHLLSYFQANVKVSEMCAASSGKSHSIFYTYYRTVPNRCSIQNSCIYAK